MPFRQRSNPFVLIQVLFQDYVVVFVILTLPYAETFRQTGQLIILIQIADLKDIIGIIVNLLLSGITLLRHYPLHLVIQAGGLGNPATSVILEGLSCIAFRQGYDIHVVIPDAAHPAVKGIIYMNNAVITIRQYSRSSFMVIPGFFCQVVMIIIFIGLISISVFLQSRIIVFVKPGFAQQIAVAVPGLQFLGISNLLHQKIALAITVFFRQEMAADIIGIRFLSIALCGDHGLSLCAEELFGQEIAPGVILAFSGCVVPAQHIGHTGFIQVLLAQEPIFIIIFTQDFRSTGYDFSNFAVNTEVNLTGGVAVLVVLTDERSVTFRADSRIAVFIKIFFAQLMAFHVPGVFLGMVSFRNLYWLVLCAEVGNAQSIAHIIGFGYLRSIAKGSICRFTVSIQIRNRCLIDIIGSFSNSIAFAVFLQGSVCIVARFLNYPSLGVNLPLQLGISGTGRSNKLSLFVVISPQGQISGMVIFHFIGSIALGDHNRFSLGIQVFHLGGQAGFRIIGQFVGSETVALKHRTAVCANVQFIGHVVGVVVFTL